MAAFVRLLGSPAVRQESGWLEPPVGKTSALLYYLAYREGWVSRDDLLYLLWPDMPEHTARKNLRPLLYKLRRFSYAQGLEIEISRLRWRVESDVKAFKQAVAEHKWPQAVNLYGGELLEGFSLEGAPEFGSWLELERNELQGMWRDAAVRFASDLEETRRYEEAAQVLERLYKTDPLDEVVLRQYLRSLHLSRERHKALEAFATFKRTLQQEMGLEAEADTLRLVEHIRSGTPFEAADAGNVVPAAQEKRQVRMPLQATPFIGRGSEKAKLAAQLSKPACRLLSLVAPGGMGKTRLAIEVATEQREAFADGVVFAPFDAVPSVDFMVPALAGALDFSFFGNQDPKQQLLAYLQDKEMLLVLDNLEHLLDGARLIADVLASSPNLKILATSRERLNLHAEWVFDLGGMAVPSKEAAGLEDYDAVQLFLQAAQQARADFAVDDASLRAITRICRFVEGMPLALELAAGWLRLLTVEEVADRLATGIDFLEAPSRDRPERHKSIRAVFEHSWSLLQPREQEVLRRLSVFQGGFTLAAAETVAGAGLPLLLALINKSFLRRSSTGRFSRHPLVRQFVEEKAQEHPEEKAESEARHGRYFATFLQERSRWMRGGARQQLSLQEMDEELDNIRLAWRWAIKHHNVSALEQSFDSLYHYYYDRALLQEGEDAFRDAAEYLGENVLKARLLARQGVFAWSLYHLELSEEVSRESLAILSRLGLPPDTYALINLACSAMMRQDWELAKRHNVDLLEASKANGDLWGMACALNNLGNIANVCGALERAEPYLQESIALFRQLDDRWGLAMALDNLGYLHLQRNELEKAAASWQESLGFARAIGHPSLTAGASEGLGAIRRRLGQLEQAKAYYNESLAIYRKRGSYGPPIPTEPHIFWPLLGLAETTHALKEYRESLTYYREAFAVALRFEAHVDAVNVLLDTAKLFVSMGAKERALLLLGFLLNQPQMSEEVNEQAKQLWAGLLAALPTQVVASTQERAGSLGFEDIKQLLAIS